MGLLSRFFGASDRQEQKRKKFRELERFVVVEGMCETMKASWLTSRGNAYGEEGKLKEAMEDFTEAINIKKDYLPAYLGLAVTYKTQGQEKEALEILEAAPEEMRTGNNVTVTRAQIIENFRGLEK